MSTYVHVIRRGYDTRSFHTEARLLSPIPSYITRDLSHPRAFASVGTIGKAVVICGGQTAVATATANCERLMPDR